MTSTTKDEFTDESTTFIRLRNNIEVSCNAGNASVKIYNIIPTDKYIIGMTNADVIYRFDDNQAKHETWDIYSEKSFEEHNTFIQNPVIFMHSMMLSNTLKFNVNYYGTIELPMHGFNEIIKNHITECGL